MGMEQKLLVHGILTDPNTEAQIVILRDEASSDILPIWVGASEGNAIRFALEGITPPRPLTHDLAKNLLEQLGADLVKVVVTEVKNNTYFAQIVIRKNGAEQAVDSRPSDAIALALRAHAPIYAASEVVKRHSSENLDTWLEKLKPKNSGQYDA